MTGLWSRREVAFIHAPRPRNTYYRGLTIDGQSLPDLPASARSVLGSNRETPDPPVRKELVTTEETPYVLDGVQTVSFTVTRDRDLTPLAGK